jgi:hypothetical protein
MRTGAGEQGQLDRGGERVREREREREAASTAGATIGSPSLKRPSAKNGRRPSRDGIPAETLM